MKKLKNYGLPLLAELEGMDMLKKRKSNIQNRRYFVEDILVKGIYKLFKNDIVVYVGQSRNNVMDRICRHYLDKEKDFDSFTFMDFSNKTNEELDQIEKNIINKYWPKYNIRHNS